MKALVCLYGQVRNDVKIVKDNLQKLFNGYKIDFLISTWSDEMINDFDFNYVLRSDPPTENFLNQINFPYTQQLKVNIELRHGRIGHYAQFLHNFKIQKFIKENNLDYDILIKSRVDLVFDTKYNFDFKKDCCYLPKTYHASVGVGINDHFISGKFDYIKKAIQFNNFEDIYDLIRNSWNPEVVNLKLLEYNNCNYEQFDCLSYILLPNRKFL